ncbi:hypothetical protein Tco_0030912 [Tanacetum coccineum]
MIDYSLWEVIENGNAPPITKVIEGVETIIAPTTAEEKAQRRLELKARSTLLMGIPNEHQLKFNSIKDAKSLLGQGLVDTLSLDDLYNNLKIYEPEVKGTSSSSSNTQHVAFVSSNSTSSTNGAVNTAHSATTASTSSYYCLESAEARLLVYKTNESVYEEDIKVLKRKFMPPKLDLSFTGLEEFLNKPIVSEPTVKEPIVETSEAKASAAKPKAVRKNNGAPIIKDWISDSKNEAESKPKIKKKIVKPSFAKIEFVKSKKQVNTVRPKAVLNAVKGNHVNTARPKVVLNALKRNQGTCPILLTLKKLMEDMLPLEVTPKEGKSQAEGLALSWPPPPFVVELRCGDIFLRRDLGRYYNGGLYSGTGGECQDTTDAEINYLLDVQIQQEIPHIQSPSVLTVPVFVTSEPSVLTHIPKTPSLALARTLLPPPSVSTISHIQRISLTGFPAQSVGSSKTDVLDSPCLLVLITGTSQSRQHVSTSSIHIESCKSPTAELFEVNSWKDFC